MNANRTIATIVAAVLLVAAVAFAAFTLLGEDKSPSAGGTTPNETPGSMAGKKVAVRKLNALCTDARRQMNDFSYPSTPAGFVVYMDKINGVYGNFMRKLVRIDPGPSNKQSFEKIVQDYRVTAGYAEDVQAAAQAGDLAKLQTIQQDFLAAVDDMNGRARDFGAHACVAA